MIHDYLPMNRADMNIRGWNQCDFVYVSGDAYVDHPSFGQPSSAGFWKPTATRWESSPSRTGKIRRAFGFWESPGLAFWYPAETWTPW